MALAPLAQTLLVTAGTTKAVLTEAVTVPSQPVATTANTRANSTFVRANNTNFAAPLLSIQQQIAAHGG